MMQQASLDFSNRRARRTDPDTSKEAARRATGLARETSRAIYEYLESILPYSATIEDIGGAGLPNVDKYEAARRCAELRDAGLIKEDGQKPLRSGRNGTLWKAKA